MKAPLRLHRGELYTKIREPYFFGYVRDLLIKKYGVTAVRSGGLKVHTTIDPRFQKLAKQAIETNLYLSTDPASALVSINPKNGAIRAMAAVAPGRKGLQFNLAEQGRRQAGSSFKTFVLAEAIKQGINPDSTRYMSAPFTWQPDPLSEPWEVSTFDHSYYGVSTIRQATIRSDNTVYARLTLDVGPENVAQTAQEMGIKTKLEPVASIGLGSNAVSVLEMASAYATLAAGGIYSEPMAIRKVVLPSGKVDPAWGKGKRERVMTDGEAYVVTQILQENVLGGTGTAANPGRPAAGKTGHDRRLRRRVVRRLHAEPRDSGVGRLPERADRDAKRARDLGLGRLLPGHDLARLRRPGARRLAGPLVPASDSAGRLAPVPRPVGVLRAAAGRGQGQRQGQRQGQGHDERLDNHRAAPDDHGAASDDDGAAPDDDGAASDDHAVRLAG